MNMKEILVMSEDLETRVRYCIASNMHLDVSEVKPTSTLKKDLGADDLDLKSLRLAIEEEFEIELDDKTYARLLEASATVADVTKIVKSKLA